MDFHYRPNLGLMCERGGLEGVERNVFTQKVVDFWNVLLALTRNFGWNRKSAIRGWDLGHSSQVTLGYIRTPGTTSERPPRKKRDPFTKINVRQLFASSSSGSDESPPDISLLSMVTSIRETYDVPSQAHPLPINHNALEPSYTSLTLTLPQQCTTMDFAQVACCDLACTITVWCSFTTDSFLHTCLVGIYLLYCCINLPIKLHLVKCNCSVPGACDN